MMGSGLTGERRAGWAAGGARSAGLMACGATTVPAFSHAPNPSARDAWEVGVVYFVCVGGAGEDAVENAMAEAGYRDLTVH